MQPFLAASSFLLELYVCICDCRGACVGTAIIIDFGKQVRIVCLPRKAHIETVSKAGHVPPLTVLLRHLQRQIVLTEPL